MLRFRFLSLLWAVNMLLLLWVVSVGAGTWLTTTSYDFPFDRVCPNDTAIYGIKSTYVYSNNKQDRAWQFYCETDYNLDDSSATSWTDYQNTLGGNLNFSCAANEALVGISSDVNNTINDRKFRFKCKKLIGLRVSNCRETDYINDIGVSMDKNLNTINELMVGLSSSFDSMIRDRRWKMRFCDLCSAPVMLSSWSSWTNCPTCRHLAMTSVQQTRSRVCENKPKQKECSNMTCKSQYQTRQCNNISLCQDTNVYGHTPLLRVTLDSFMNGIIIPEPHNIFRQGIVTAWQIHARRPGPVTLQIWRNTRISLEYELVTETSYTVNICGVHRIELGQFAQVNEGDVIGFQSRDFGVISYNNRDCAGHNTLVTSLATNPNPSVGVKYNFIDINNTVNPCRKYSLAAMLLDDAIVFGYKAKDRAVHGYISNVMYIPNWNEPVQGGTLRGWQIYAYATGTVQLQILRKVSGLNYTTILDTVYHVGSVGVHVIEPVTSVFILTGDVIGFYFPGSPIIPFAGSECTDQRALYKESLDSANVKVGSTYAFGYLSYGSASCRKYSVQTVIVKAPPCKIDLRASGMNDPVPRGDGFVKLNNQSVTADKGRGFTLVTITPDCKVNKITHYDTVGVMWAGAIMRDYLNALPPSTRVAGITDDTYMQYLFDAKPILAQFGVDLSGSGYRTSLAFVAVKGQPTKTTQKTAARYKGPVLVSATLIL